MKCCRIDSSEIGGLMGKDLRIKRRRDTCAGSDPALRPFFPFWGTGAQRSAPDFRR